MSALGRMADYDELERSGFYCVDDEAPWPSDPPPTEDHVEECETSAGSEETPAGRHLPSHNSLSSHSGTHPTSEGVQSCTPSGPPELADGALHGLVGEYVRRIDPHTEADPAAVLVTLLAVLGNAIGPSPYVAVGATQHRTNLFALVVGATAKARKGTSLGEALRVGRLVDETWAAQCITSGIASGEGLIALVADPGEDDEPRRVDKRALVIEEEFARLLATGRREGSTVSPVLRSAWDGRPLKITTKANALTATGHLVSVVAHVTADELHAKLREVDIANGLANRFLVTFAQRSKLLPSGGALRDHDLEDLTAATRRAVRLARTRGEVRRTAAGERRWAELYEQCADDDPGGLLGAITARAEPQLLRLALVHALLDGAPAVDVAHLDAAWLLWSYCRQSAAYLFGDALGDPVADRIDAALRAEPHGLDRTALSALFGRHVRAGQLDAALELLASHRRIRTRTEDTAGRPRTVYTSRLTAPDADR